jgi:hypothetical protein
MGSKSACQTGPLFQRTWSQDAGEGLRRRILGAL